MPAWPPASMARGCALKAQSVSESAPLDVTAAVFAAPPRVLLVKLQEAKALEKPPSTCAACVLPVKALPSMLATLRSAGPTKPEACTFCAELVAPLVSTDTKTAVAATPWPSSTTGAAAVPASAMEPRTSIDAEAVAKRTVTPAAIVSEPDVATSTMLETATGLSAKDHVTLSMITDDVDA